MVVPRLTYFDMRGRAEAIRLSLYAMEVNFDDRRILTAEAWNNLMPSTDFGSLLMFETGDFEQ